MLIGVFGPRDFKGVIYNNYGRVAEVLDTFDAKMVISGGGKGVEQLALRYAEENAIEPKVVPPHIQALGAKVAFEKRNEEIIRQLDIGIVFWDGKERFYGDLIAKIVLAGKNAFVAGLE